MGEPETIIRVENLSKKYLLSHQNIKPSNTLRDALSHALQALWRRLRQPWRLLEGETREEFWALRDVSFEVKRGHVIGIIGRNGAGKSTLLKILSRITDPTLGRLVLDGRVASLLEVGTGFHPELTGRENVFLNGAILGMRRSEIVQKFDEIIAFAEVDKFVDTPVKHYSSGMYMRLAFAVAAHLEPEILIVDEVLAVGDSNFQKKCLGKMGKVASEGRTVLFVSHNMSAVKSLCTRALLLDHGLLLRDGAVSDLTADYLGMAQFSEVSFTNKPIKRFCIRQVGSTIEVNAEFEVDRQLPMASLGFIVSDHMGNPVFGTNPKICGIDNFGKLTSKGRITATVSQPKLLDGCYHVSVWFGDGQEDFFKELHCASFEVHGMAGMKQQSTSLVGYVEPECQWEFENIN